MSLPSHHAYLFILPRTNVDREVLPRIEKELAVSTKSNPDFSVSTFETFGIDDAHALSERAVQRGVGSGPKVFVVIISAITREAQNALLKLLEDSPRDTYFFFCMESDGRLLPTLRSRLFITRITTLSSQVPEAKKFLALSIPERMTLLKPYLDSEEVSRNRDVQSFLSQLAEVLIPVVRKNPIPEYARALERLLTLSRYASQTGPSRKMILEELAVMLPHP